ncbi:hypothetical protein DNK56_14355 [Streptomyces sp. AC1-42W]|nr:hypothetical protein DNK55_17080 [Streptomyces sp. AC1-42T]PZT83110.1 hypothetical protein DNK56_14355 [Streptomyces sp. AC1-42W]
MTTRCPFSVPQDPVSRVSNIRGQGPVFSHTHLTNRVDVPGQQGPELALYGSPGPPETPQDTIHNLCHVGPTAAGICPSIPSRSAASVGGQSAPWSLNVLVLQPQEDRPSPCHSAPGTGSSGENLGSIRRLGECVGRIGCITQYQAERHRKTRPCSSEAHRTSKPQVSAIR